MKQLLLISMLLLSGVRCVAEEANITLYRNSLHELADDKRSTAIAPTATINKSTICLYSELALNSVTILVKDDLANIVYSYTDALDSKNHIFELPALLEGEYQLEFIIGGDTYLGRFSM